MPDARVDKSQKSAGEPSYDGFLPQKGWKRILVGAAYALLIAAGAFIGLKYLLPMFAPFIIAWIAAALVQPLIRLICKKAKISRKFVGAVLVTAVLVGLGTGVFFICERVFSELRGLLEALSSDSDSLLGAVRDFLDRVSERFPFLGDVTGDDELLSVSGDMIKRRALDPVLRRGGACGQTRDEHSRRAFLHDHTYHGGILHRADFSGVTAALSSRLPAPARVFAERAKKSLSETGTKYLRAYVTMMAITFLQLLCGLLILGVDYAFTIALFTAVADALPVIGVGTILIPWGLIELAGGNFYVGFGLLIIFAIVSVSRQIIEPRVVGVNLGISPLATLAAMYAGYKLIGVLGMFAAPMLAIIVKNLFFADKGDA